MCPANHINSRSLLRSSSTREHLSRGERAKRSPRVEGHVPSNNAVEASSGAARPRTITARSSLLCEGRRRCALVHRRVGPASCVLPVTRLLSAFTSHSRGQGDVEGAGVFTVARFGRLELDALRDCEPPGPRPPHAKSACAFFDGGEGSTIWSSAPRVPTLRVVCLSACTTGRAIRNRSDL